MPFAGPLRSGRFELIADGRSEVIGLEAEDRSEVIGLNGCPAMATVVALRKAARRIRTNARILSSTAVGGASFPALTEAYKYVDCHAGSPPVIPGKLTGYRRRSPPAAIAPPGPGSRARNGASRGTGSPYR